MDTHSNKGKPGAESAASAKEAKQLIDQKVREKEA